MPRCSAKYFATELSVSLQSSMYHSYQKYRNLKSKGLRKQANVYALLVIEEYNADPDDNFPFVIINDAKGDKIHYFLFRHIVYPFLKSRIKSDPDAIRCLINVIRNVYQDKDIHKDFDWITEQQLLRRLLFFDPHDKWAKSRVKESIADWLRYTIHEWPWGILYGHNGATLPECREILDAVTELRSLDESSDYKELADEVELKTIQYCNRLADSRNK